MSDSKAIVITIDGPSGVGKSTISKRVASELGFTYLDTGAMYRAVALHMQRKNVNISSLVEVTRELEDIAITLLPAASEDDDVGVLLNGQEVGSLIRTPEISMLASRISAIPVVRTKLTRMQQEIGNKGTIVAEGRDTGTVVFPSADFKFYLDATPRYRARRRVDQLRARGETVDEKELLKMLIIRDKNDSERAVAPLRKADDAVYIDTSGISVAQVLSKIREVVTLK